MTEPYLNPYTDRYEPADCREAVSTLIGLLRSPDVVAVVQRQSGLTPRKTRRCLYDAADELERITADWTMA